jgi:hypothetical protein
MPFRSRTTDSGPMRNGAAATIVLLTLASVAGCSSTPAPSAKLTAARSAVQKAESLGNLSGVARTDLDAARHYLQQAEDSRRSGGKSSQVDTLAYASEQLATAAMARRDSLMLQDAEVRNHEAKMAEHKAETAEMEAERARQLAESQKN